ncbi:unnamed protein product [Rotaria sordida]|uniref:Uncharacterized protein n=1 Tax=Rotaria sordida TaxID=392033 RepID=A0A815G8J8_9BILA|nr:unnamed protein product [Rotaria sordida]CAF1335230.1 unnamed protein product [Rotaria sordida]CAF1344726.1 unnamed protein product [Rotaria sordida]CAF1366836.1 unnamed protein product [Rotaria sordida]CAF3624522.1 unnamed protein product [Rotaria sordida]
MLIELLIFILILISTNYSYNYFVRFKSHDAPCLILSIDSLWLRCIINQSDPLKFFSKTLLSHINIEFILISINNLTLPSNFFIDDNNNNNNNNNNKIFSDYSSIKNNHNVIIFDTTKNFQLKQINILKNTFLNIFSTKIHFILHNCGYPILHIEQNIFYSNIIKQIFVTYNNRSRTVFLKDFFSHECLIDEEIIFQNENEYQLIKFNFLNKKNQFNSTKLLINGLLFTIVISLTSILMCLIIRKTTRLKTVSLFYDIIQSDRTSNILPTSELSTPIVSYVP